MPDSAARSRSWSACARLSSAARADSRAFSATGPGTLGRLVVEAVLGDVLGHGQGQLGPHALAGGAALAPFSRPKGDPAGLDERAPPRRQRLRGVRRRAPPRPSTQA